MSNPSLPSQGQTRIVIDAVGFVRSLISPRSAWGAVVFEYASAYVLLMSNELEAEIRDVLGRPALTGKFDLLSSELDTILVAILKNTERVTLTEVPRVCRDPNDDKVIATAVTGGAAFIATEDKDLLDMVEHQGVRIVTGLQLLEILRQ